MALTFNVMRKNALHPIRTGSYVGLRSATPSSYARLHLFHGPNSGSSDMETDSMMDIIMQRVRLAKICSGDETDTINNVAAPADTAPPVHRKTPPIKPRRGSNFWPDIISGIGSICQTMTMQFPGSIWSTDPSWSTADLTSMQPTAPIREYPTRHFVKRAARIEQRSGLVYGPQQSRLVLQLRSRHLLIGIQPWSPWFPRSPPR